LREFLADLRSILGISLLRRVGRKALDDCPAIAATAAQVAYFVLLFLFPFLMLLWWPWRVWR
jgi:hypothetical protein